MMLSSKLVKLLRRRLPSTISQSTPIKASTAKPAPQYKGFFNKSSYQAVSFAVGAGATAGLGLATSGFGVTTGGGVGAAGAGVAAGAGGASADVPSGTAFTKGVSGVTGGLAASTGGAGLTSGTATGGGTALVAACFCSAAKFWFFNSSNCFMSCTFFSSAATRSFDSLIVFSFATASSSNDWIRSRKALASLPPLPVVAASLWPTPAASPLDSFSTSLLGAFAEAA